MKKVIKCFHAGEKGFTLIELLVVVAILGVLAAVAVPNVGKFIGQGNTQAYETELHNIQTATIAMLVDSTAGVLDAAASGVSDLDLVLADSGNITLSSYVSGINADGTVKTGCTYDFTVDGEVGQTTP